MEQLGPGERVRIDIPDETDPDYRYHGKEGTIESVVQDDAGDVTGDSRDSRIYRVKLDSGATIDVRWRDIRPPFG